MTHHDKAHARGAQVNELKRLLLALGIAQSEARRVQEQLDECRKHAAFLDAITPPEWFVACSAQHAAGWQARGALRCLIHSDVLVLAGAFRKGSFCPGLGGQWRRSHACCETLVERCP